jgi:hypothetical protein
MKFKIESFKNDIVEKTISITSINELKPYLKKIYGGNPLYPTDKYSNIKAIREQAQLICDKMGNYGFNKFPDLINKFSSAPSGKNEIAIIRNIKETMEAILYHVEKNSARADELAVMYGDREFNCKEGTLTNLQSILEEFLLQDSGIDAYIAAQKKELISQIAADMNRAGEFKDLWKFSFMEIHNIPALINRIANKYNLVSKPNYQDQWAPSISKSSALKLESKIEEQIKNQAVVDGFVDSITMNIFNNLPLFDKSQSGFFGLLDKNLESLKIDTVGTQHLLVVDEDYNPLGYKANIRSIIKDAITLYLYNKNIIEHPEIEEVKLRLALENESKARSADMLNDLKERGLLEKGIKYIIDNNLKLDEDSVGTTDCVKYAIEHDIKIDDMNAKQYALVSITKKYLNTTDNRDKLSLENRYQEISDMSDSEKLLDLDSALSRFLDRDDAVAIITKHNKEKKLVDFFKEIDFTKCDLKLIEKCMQIADKVEKNKPRDYDQFTINQKVLFVFSLVLAPIAYFVYQAINKYNDIEKERSNQMLTIEFNPVQKDLDRVSSLANLSEIVKIEAHSSQKNFSEFSNNIIYEIGKCSERPLTFEQQELIVPALKTMHDYMITKQDHKLVSEMIIELAKTALLKPSHLEKAVKDIKTKLGVPKYDTLSAADSQVIETFRKNLTNLDLATTASEKTPTKSITR